MPAARPQDVLVTAARLYYLQDKSQGEIAKALGLSRSTVSRILAAAREQGVVEIRIHHPGAPQRVEELEAALRRVFGIASACVVVRPASRTATDAVAEMAARLFEDRLSHLTLLGMSWGSTVGRFVDHVGVEPIYTSLQICPLVGGMPTLNTGPAGNTSLEILASKCGATPFRFESPSVVESRETWVALSRESSIVAAIQRASAVEMALVGIGSYGFHSSQRVVSAMHLNAEETALLDAQHPAGDITGRFFDVDGRPLGPPTSERVIGITLEELAAIPQVVGMAGGVEKASGVVGALHTGILDEIVLDDELARAVLALELQRT